MRRKSTTLVLSVIAGVIFGSGIAYASDAVHFGFRPVPAYVQAYSGLAAESKTAISNSCLTWNNAGSGNLVYKSSTEHNDTTYPNNNGVNQITKGNRGTDKYLMQTSFWTNWQGYATEADIDINGDHPWSNNLTAGTYDVQNVMTHEIGHLLGLADHYDQQSSEITMYGYSDRQETKKRTLEQADLDGLFLLNY